MYCPECMSIRKTCRQTTDGQANLPRFVKRLRQPDWDVVVFLHGENKSRASFRTRNSQELLTQLVCDLGNLKRLVR